MERWKCSKVPPTRARKIKKAKVLIPPAFDNGHVSIIVYSRPGGVVRYDWFWRS